MGDADAPPTSVRSASAQIHPLRLPPAVVVAVVLAPVGTPAAIRTRSRGRACIAFAGLIGYGGFRWSASGLVMNFSVE